MFISETTLKPEPMHILELSFPMPVNMALAEIFEANILPDYYQITNRSTGSVMFTFKSLEISEAFLGDLDDTEIDYVETYKI